MRNSSPRYSPTSLRRKPVADTLHGAILIGIAGLFVTLAISALALANRLGHLEQKIDTLWEWWHAHVDIRVGGRRRTDVAADDGTEP
jgi:hypothetical protein